MIVDAIRGKHSLPVLLNALDFSKSSYYYQAHRKIFKMKYRDVSRYIKEVFVANNSCYGYQQITALLKCAGVILSEKVVRGIMHDNKLVIKCRKARKYSS